MRNHFDDMEESLERRACLAKSITFDVANLPAIEHGIKNRPLLMSDGFSVTTADQDKLRLTSLFQFGTYDGNLAGIPAHPESNIEMAVDQAKTIFAGHPAPPCVIAPVIHCGVREFTSSAGPQTEPWRILPSITSFGLFTASRPAVSSDEAYSSVLLIWYQDRFGLPDDPRTLKLISELDWECFAYNWTG